MRSYDYQKWLLQVEKLCSLIDYIGFNFSHSEIRLYCVYLPQTVPAAIEAPADVIPVAEAKTLPQRRPPLVWSGTEMAAMAAVSAPGIWNRYVDFLI